MKIYTVWHDETAPNENDGKNWIVDTDWLLADGKLAGDSNTVRQFTDVTTAMTFAKKLAKKNGHPVYRIGKFGEKEEIP